MCVKDSLEKRARNMPGFLHLARAGKGNLSDGRMTKGTVDPQEGWSGALCGASNLDRRNEIGRPCGSTILARCAPPVFAARLLIRPHEIARHSPHFRDFHLCAAG